MVSIMDPLPLEMLSLPSSPLPPLPTLQIHSLEREDEDYYGPPPSPGLELTLDSPMPLPSSPSYAPSSEVPHYSPEPSADERRLDFVERGPNRSQQRATPVGTFVKKLGSVTIVLHEQEDGVDVPTYSRGGVVRGQILLDDEASVQSVSVVLSGHQTDMITGDSTHERELFNISSSLWSKDKGSRPSTSTCPPILAFSIPFPRAYTYGQTTVLLPPTFCEDLSSVYAQCKYTLAAVVVKSGLGGFKRKKTASTNVRFQPRSRPYLPIGNDLMPFFSTVKSAPGDWHQVTSTMKSRDALLCKPLEAHLFIPAVQVYSLTDTVPFHLQLRGPVASLRSFLTGPSSPPRPFSPPKWDKSLTSTSSLTRALANESSFSQSSRPSTPLPSTPPLSPPSSAFSLLSPSSSRSSSPLPPPPPFGSRYSLSGSSMRSELSTWSGSSGSSDWIVRVQIMRQVLIQVGGQKVWKDIVLGEGKIWPLFSEDIVSSWGHLTSHLTSGQEQDQVLDWEGEVRCKDGVTTVGSFVSGTLRVKDFVVLELRPPSSGSGKQPLIEHRHAHPIKLVTDSYSET